MVDGDTLDIGCIRIRLHGIDAPESGQLCHRRAGEALQCGQAAALALADRIGSAPISCDPRDTDKYGRTVAVCRKGAEDLNGWLVAQGQRRRRRQPGGEQRRGNRGCLLEPVANAWRLSRVAWTVREQNRLLAICFGLPMASKT